LFRTRFSSFSELIRKGVMTDTHPPLVQVLLYFWVHFCGYSEWVVKLPFTLAGIASVFLIYLIAKEWFNETVGLISATYLATLQFAITYSQIARPYISGLFFSLLMVFFWGKLMLKPEKRFYQNALLFVLSATLCAYNHHFSLLFAAIVGLSGLFFIQRKYLVNYIISGVLIFLLYLPNLPIFFIQLGMGGVEEWLGKPHNDFFFQYLAYIFHFSFIPVIVAIAILIYGFVTQKYIEIKWKWILLSFAWFVLPFLVGFFYSRYINAILQYSMLIFTFPFLFFVLFGHVKPQKPFINLVIVVLLMLVNCYTLVVDRKYYQLFYQSPYDRIVSDQQKVTDSLPGTPCVLYGNKKVIGEYLNRYKVDTTSFLWYETPANLHRYLSDIASKSDYFYLGELSYSDALTVPIILDYFPAIIWQKDYAAGTTYLFGKNGQPGDSTISVFNKEGSKQGWRSFSPALFNGPINAIGQKSYLMDSTTEWSPTFSIPLWNVIDNENNYIDLSLKVYSNSGLKGLIIASSLVSGDSTIHWCGTDASIFQPMDSTLRWIKILHTIKLPDVYLNYKDIELNCYLWKQPKSSIYIDDFTISLRRGNPNVYGLTEKIPE
jgi:hypothetical protein